MIPQIGRGSISPAGPTFDIKCFLLYTLHQRQSSYLTLSLNIACYQTAFTLHCIFTHLSYTSPRMFCPQIITYHLYSGSSLSSSSSSTLSLVSSGSRSPSSTTETGA